jgi:CHAD domain-containing protein
MRVAGRRARVALGLLATNADGRRVRRARRAFRALIRAAGRSRDLDVSLGLFDAVVGPRAAAARPSRLLRRRLVAARGKSRRRMQDALLDQDLARLRRDLRVVVARRIDPLPAALPRMAAARDTGGAEVQALIRELGDRFDDEALHHLRTRLRRLRYLAELDAELRGTPAAAVKPLKRLQERLGEAHDAFVLATWLGRQAAAAEARAQVELAAEARRLEAHLVTDSRAAHQRFVAEDPAGAVGRAVARIGRQSPASLRPAWPAPRGKRDGAGTRARAASRWSGWPGSTGPDVSGGGRSRPTAPAVPAAKHGQGIAP